MKSLSTSRSLRSNSSPAPMESPGREREPFFVGPFRQQNNFAFQFTPGRSRSRANGENVPPEINHTAATAAYVKVSTPTPDTGSPAPRKSSRKARNGGTAPPQGSPVLLPRSISTKSPCLAKPEPAFAQVQDNLVTAKRKLHWDVSGSDTLGFTAIADSTVSDTGVRVILRMRPLNSKEKQEDTVQIVQKISPDAVYLGDQQFTYDAVASENTSQHEVFEIVGLPMVENCLAGFNSSIFAYGQTGSGKTHTMMGVATDPYSSSSPSEERGLIPRVIERLFTRMLQEEETHSDKELRYQCRCSFLEIYNEQITDLLEPTLKNLQIREDPRTGIYVDSLSEEFVSNVDDATRLLRKGFTNRRTSATILNNESSRSHSVFTCVIESRFKNLAEGGNSVRSSRMNLVDLAGSERQKQTRAAGERLKEAGNINKSLSQLGNVINILADVAQTGRQRHIPYRDSRLTFLLQESLGGNAKLAMICAISPASRNETLSTLRFAQRAKAIQNKAVVNEETANDVGLLREQIRQLKDELMRMRSNGNQESTVGAYSNGCNARRSYNLLRWSLSHPMTLSAAGFDTDLEMELEEVDTEPDTEVLDSQSGAKSDTGDANVARLPVIDEKSCLLEDTCLIVHMSERSQSSICATNIHTSESGGNAFNVGSEVSCSPVKAHYTGSLSNIDHCRNVNPKTIPSPELMKVQTSKILHSPPQSVSPRLKEVSNRKTFGSPQASIDDLLPVFSTCEEIFHSTQEVFCDKTSTSELLLSKNDALHATIRASMSTSRPTEKLAACLHRGLQILDDQQRSSAASLRRSTAGLRLSTQESDLLLHRRLVGNIDRGVQTSPVVLVARSTSPLFQSVPQPETVEAISSCRLLLADCVPCVPPATGIELLGNSLKELESCDLQLSRSIESPRGTAGPNDVHFELSGNPIQKLEDGHQILSSQTSVEEPVNELLLLSGDAELSRNIGDEPGHRSLHDISESTCHTPTSMTFQSSGTSSWQLVTSHDPKSSSVTPSYSSSPQFQLAQAVEALLAGAIRRERAAEEETQKHAVEIEQLSRLVRQYKHERECNAILHQTREDKIARLESLMDGVLPTDAYLNEEWSSLLLEFKMLQEKFDNHPEVTQSNLEQQGLRHELNQYRNFFDTGEREILLEEVKQLRNQLQILLKHSCIPSTFSRQRQLSGARTSLQTSNFAEAATEHPSPSSLALLAIPQEALLKNPTVDLSMAACSLPREKEEKAEPLLRSSSQCRKDEKRDMERDWEERERDWMAVLEELREEAELNKRQADRRKQEFECEKRCSEEMQDALQMAMTCHARLLEQYAELQEKHIVFLARHRKIKEGTAIVKKMAKKAGVTSIESRWLDAQALQMAALRVEMEENSQRSQKEIQGLEAQLRDTVDAVQAAGELLVRLKEAEESVMIAQDGAAIAEQNASSMRRELEKSRRRHTTEVATLQQRLLESRLQKTAMCPMCVMAERVKFQFTEEGAETAQAALEAEAWSFKENRQWMALLHMQNLANDQNEQQEDGSVCTGGGLEDHGEHFSEEVDLDEVDEIDQIFTHS